MVLGYNAYNSAIMPDNGPITDHNCYQFQCDLEQVVKPTPDQLVGGLNPTRTSSPSTRMPSYWSAVQVLQSRFFPRWASFTQAPPASPPGPPPCPSLPLPLTHMLTHSLSLNSHHPLSYPREAQFLARMHTHHVILGAFLTT